jgi:hypothetical protein
VSVVVVKGVDQMISRLVQDRLRHSSQSHPAELNEPPDRDPETDHYAPRDTVTYTVKISDYAGKPVQAEISLAMVDLAVLSLLDRLQLPIADQFYGERGLGIRTGVALVYSVDRINVKLAEEAGAAAQMQPAATACVAISAILLSGRPTSPPMRTALRPSRSRCRIT